MSLQVWRAERDAAAGTILRLRDVIKNESRDFNSEEKAEWERANRSYDSADEKIKAVMKAREIERDGGDYDFGGALPGTENRGFKKPRRELPAGEVAQRATNIAAAGWLGYQTGKPLTRQQVMACKAAGINPKAKTLDIRLMPNGYQKRDLSVVTNTAGEYTVADGFVNALEKSLLAYGSVRSVATVLRTDNGAPLPWPTVSDHQNAAELLAENTPATKADPTFGVVNFGAYKFSSKLVQVPNELMQDSAFDLAKTLGELLGERISRTQNTHFTTGSGSGQPQGLVTAAGVGVTAASATAVTMDEILDLVHSVDPAYRVDPSTAFMMADSILKVTRKLKDSTGAYLWQPSVQLGVPETLLNYPVYVNQQMATALAVSAKPIVFGAMKKFVIRDAGMIRIKRMDERYAENDQTAFLALLRSDSRLLDAGTDPIRVLQMAAV